MPEQLKTYDRKRKTPTKYPWASWFNGKILRLRRGKEFSSTPASMADAVRKAAKRTGYEVTVFTEDNAVVLQPKKGGLP